LGKAVAAFIRRADESTLSKMLIESAILLAASRMNATTVLPEAAGTYKVDADAIAQKVRQEFAAKAKAKKETKPVPKTGRAA
jgi:ParB family chromosome partitioning protein